MIGHIISHYEILEKLGEGGMGIVYKAHDTKLERTVALKFLPPHLNASEQDKARFTQEAKAAATLNHPNICTIHDIQEHEGQTFIVMEYVDGQTLRERRGTISYKQAIDIGIQIADGLAAAHEKGIVHRDIKPENIMLRKDGIAQIMDFGLAKLRSASSKINRLTKEGSTVGTAGYMSPEQIQGIDADHRSDIFSYGIVLFELLTGQLPFKGVHETALAYEIVNVDAPPMSSIKPEIDPSLDAIVLECLEKDVNERAQSMKQIAVDLKRYKRESSRQRVSRVTAARPVMQTSGTMPAETAVPTASGLSNDVSSPHSGRRKISGLWPMMTGILTLVLAALLWHPWGSPSVGGGATLKLSLNLPDSMGMSFSTNGTQAMDISRDGRTLVYCTGNRERSMLCIRNLDEEGAKEIKGTEGATDPAFSPDGRWIAFFDGAVKKISVTGGAAELLCPVSGFTRGVYWAEDGYIYFGHVSDGIFRVSASGGPPERVAVPDTASGESSYRFPQLLPGGKKVLFTVKLDNISSFDDALIAVADVDSKEKSIIVRGGTCARYVPTGHLVYAREGALHALAFDPSSSAIDGAAIRLFDGGMTNLGSGSSFYAFSESGIMVYAKGDVLPFNRSNIVAVDRNGNAEKMIRESRPYSEAALSPDGKRIAMTVLAANDDIWVYDLERQTLTRLSLGGGNNSSPLWSPDGRRVFYKLGKREGVYILSKPWDGSTPATNHDVPQIGRYSPASFTPDGMTLALQGQGDIAVTHLDKGDSTETVVGSKFIETGGFFSPDGKWLAYASNESGISQIYVIPYPRGGGRWQVSVGGGVAPRWAKSGTELFFRNGEDIMRVSVSTAGGFVPGRPSKVLTLPNLLTFSGLTPDDRKFVCIVGEGAIVTQELSVISGWFDDLKKTVGTGAR